MRETRSEKPMGFCSSQPPLSFWKAVACSTALKGALQRQSHHARILHEVRHLCLFDCSLQVSAAIVKEFVPIWSGSFCRDSTPNGRDRPPSRDRQVKLNPSSLHRAPILKFPAEHRCKCWL